MDPLADRSILALRAIHDELAAEVSALRDDHLTATSGAADWTVAQVLSHLGSGAEIAAAGYRAALAGDAAPAQDFNESVWARWNVLSPEQQATQFLEQDAAVVALLEGLSPEQRRNTPVKLGFLPAPLPLASAIGMRLNEAAQHSWDVRVARDPLTTLTADAAEVLLEHYSGGLGFLLGFLGKADQLSEPAVITIAGTDLALVVKDSVVLTDTFEAATGRFEGDPEAFLRLLGGRLKAPYIPTNAQVSGSVTLADMQRVFPGF